MIRFDPLESRCLMSATTVHVTPGTADSIAYNFTEVNGTVFFTAKTELGAELWRTDGTDAGTVLVKDIHPGFAPIGPSDLTNTNGRLFFMADDGIHGQELWTSDGTSNGTRMVADLTPGTNSTPGDILGTLDGKVYFSPQNSQAVFVSDGNGASLIKQGTGHFQWMFSTSDGTLYFSEQVSGGNYQLWRSDGTAGGTSMLAEGVASEPVEYNGQAYFITTAGELMRSGATGPAQLLADLSPISSHVRHRPLAVLNGKLLVSTYVTDKTMTLWQYDGSAATQIATIDSGWAFYGSVVDGVLYFGALNKTSSLWRTDGTAAGTFKLTDLNPAGGLLHMQHAVLNNQFYFTRRNATAVPEATELWTSDGTVAGTRRITEIAHATRLDDNSRMVELTAAGGRLYYQGDSPEAGWEPWTSDGTAAGSKLLKDVNTSVADANSKVVGVVNNRVVFSANGGAFERQLWSVDGSGVPTLLGDLDVRSNDSPAGKIFDGMLYFHAVDPTDLKLKLWKTDGTAAGTVLVGMKLGAIESVMFKGARYFVEGGSLWRGDGNDANTVLITHFANYSEGYLTVAGDRMFFSAFTGYYRAGDTKTNDGRAGTELFTSDGTAAGTYMVQDLDPRRPYIGQGSSVPKQLTELNGKLLFVATYPGGLYTTNGAPNSATKIGPGGSSLVKMGSAVYFISSGHLWKTDGTAAGTMLVTDTLQINSDLTLSTDGTTLFFAAVIDGQGQELWKSDGTAGGTVLVKDINPGKDGSSLDEIQAINGSIFFRANDGVHGDELWISDGTAAGTHLVADVNPGSDGSSPTTIGLADGHVFFVGANRIEGQQLWMVDADHTPPPVVPTPNIAPAPSYSLVNRILSIRGTDGNDTLIVRRSAANASRLELVLNGVVKAGIDRFSDLAYIQIDGRGGNDKLGFDPASAPLVMKTKLLGGAGNDTIYGSAGSDNIRGGSGNDWISGGAGNDALYGEAGNDKLFGGAGDDLLDGGTGTDALRGDDGRDRIFGTVGFDDYTKNRGDILTLSH